MDLVRGQALDVLRAAAGGFQRRAGLVAAESAGESLRLGEHVGEALQVRLRHPAGCLGRRDEVQAAGGRALVQQLEERVLGVRALSAAPSSTTDLGEAHG